MKALFATLFTASVVALAGAQSTATLIATYQGKAVGSATFTTEMKADHSIVESATFNVTIQGMKTMVKSTEQIDAMGRTIRSENILSGNGVTQRHSVIQFSAAGAEVTDKLTGTKKSYPKPAGAELKDPSALWFITTKPKVGQTVSATSFSADSFKWQKVSRSYTGDKTIEIGGKKVSGHQVNDVTDGASVSAIVDDKGLPLDLEVSGLHFMRKP